MPKKKAAADRAVRVNISLPPGDLDALDKIADRDFGGNRSAAIGALAKKALGESPKGKGRKK